MSFCPRFAKILVCRKSKTLSLIGPLVALAVNKLVVKKSQSIPGWSKYHVSNSKVAKLASSLGSLVSFLH